MIFKANTSKESIDRLAVIAGFMILAGLVIGTACALVIVVPSFIAALLMMDWPTIGILTGVSLVGLGICVGAYCVKADDKRKKADKDWHKRNISSIDPRY